MAETAGVHGTPEEAGVHGTPEEAGVRRTPEEAGVRRTLGFLLHDTSRMMRRRFVQRAREAGLPLNRSESSVLLYVAHEQGVSQAALAARLDIEPIALVRLLDGLQEQELIERRLHPTDRRVRTVWLRPGAEPVLRRIRAITAAVRREAVGDLPAAQIEALLDLLLEIRANLASTPETT
ncbi:MAG TPA: MarR family winged helix-turn-helix transcriptional regulator [Acetobacteraceae bacterium]|nr:MarR family winged helix-turn-helix transcriptional regulator [Acetobacteraceae bacterium]